ncbi:MAG: hypothetical protein Q9218_006746, partial [Villophora microphyllina]
MPRPVLRLEDPVRTTNINPLVPRFDRHDSNESFQMFSASTDSSHRARSIGGSFESSQALGSSGPIPERWTLARRPSNTPDHRRPSTSLDVPCSSPSCSRLEELDRATKQTVPAISSDKHPQRPISATRIIHEEDTFTHKPHPDSINPEMIPSKQPTLTCSDFLPSPSDPPPLPWSATAMLRPLIDYHLHSLQDTQLPTHLLLLLGPCIAHDIPPALITSLLLTYHNQLVSLSLHVQAAKLRKIAFSRGYSEIAEHGTYGISTGGAWCTVCKKGSKGDKPGFCTRCKQYRADCPVCNGEGSAALLPQDHPTSSSKENSWGWCQHCGHGGHVECLQRWWDDEEASEG